MYKKKLPEIKGVCRGEKWLISGSMFLVPTKNSVKCWVET
jgi:hypothetical protein